MFCPPVAIANNNHNIRDFDCGNTALNEFLAKYALINHNAGMARTYVVTLDDDPKVIGYYSIAAGSVERQNATARAAKGTPNQPIPVAPLARFAVDTRHQNQRLGEGMLKDALLRILNASATLAIRAVLVHAKNERAARFYSKFGFEPSPINPLHLMLLLKDIKKTVQS